MKTADGYYRFPTIHNDAVVFVCEDDLWTVSVAGGIARRLTSNLGEVSRPRLSPDGKLLAFVGREEGQPEVYLMPAVGGPARRLTYMGGSACQTVGWTKDGKILFSSNVQHWHRNYSQLYTVDSNGAPPVPLNLGLAHTIAFGPEGGLVIGRSTVDPARWKRYRGGTAGRLWIDEQGTQDFRLLLNIPGNLASPMWLGAPEALGGRIYFLSDHEGIGNIYSCLPAGNDLRRHTDHNDFYARNPSSDGRRIVYHAGADLYLFDPATEESRKIPVDFFSPQTQRNRKFVDAARYLENYALHPFGQAVAIEARGKVFSFANWEGAVYSHSEPDNNSGESLPTAARYRSPEWLNDGKRFIAVTDAEGEDAFVILGAANAAEPVIISGLDIGRPEAIAANPHKDQILFSNHRYELMFLDLETRELRLIDRGVARPISGFCWSPDGEWVAYSVSVSLQLVGLKLWKVCSGETYPLTRPVLRDVAPAFDPKGRYLYFLSYRSFDPVYDKLQLDLNFTEGMKPYLITLQKDLPSPFILQTKVFDEAEEKSQNRPEPEPPTEKDEAQDEEEATKESAEQEDDRCAKDEKKVIQIDLEGIERRIIAFPVELGSYGQILGAADGKVFYTRFAPNEKSSANGDAMPKGMLCIYDFENQREDIVLNGINDFTFSADGRWILYRSGRRLRVFKSAERPAGNDAPGRKSGWLNLDRVRVPVIPGAEWRQMFREAWRLQRDHFWTPDMSQVDWGAIYDRYLPLVDRVSSRSEFSDLLWEMQGELGTSHAYEQFGDYRPEPVYKQGYLGADFAYDPQCNAWQITHICQGDSWDPAINSPLNSLAANLQPGDHLFAINGRRLSQFLSPSAALVNMANMEITLSVNDNTPPKENSEPQPAEATEAAPDQPRLRTITVRTLTAEAPARYREWVETNRQKVYQATNGQVGYLHIPDMSVNGYAEFHRGYLAEYHRQGLIVDVRFNDGGHVSPLLLEKLARRRIGYDLSRWSQAPTPYPPESISGPVVVITNEYTGSDGDIFTHGFKMMKLGPVIGKRTWGGVVGIQPRHSLADGTVTTQPEFSFWFEDVGWGVENYGVDPDIEVDITPQDYGRGYDAQLEHAIREIQRLIQENPSATPVFGPKPSKALPELPPR